MRHVYCWVSGVLHLRVSLWALHYSNSSKTCPVVMVYLSREESEGLAGTSSRKRETRPSGWRKSSTWGEGEGEGRGGEGEGGERGRGRGRGGGEQGGSEIRLLAGEFSINTAVLYSVIIN